jgi:hypothetical protein
MKGKALFICLTILIFSVILSGCLGHDGPAIHFWSDNYNFGVVTEGNPVNHIFEFTNTGTETLIVSDVHPTCDCTVAGNFDKEIQPGKSGKIPITFDSTNYDGQVMKTVIVKTNVPSNSDYTLTLVGTVRVVIGVNPKILWLGTVERNRTTALEGKISIINKMSSPLEINDVKPSENNIEAKVQTIKSGVEYSLSVAVKPPFKEGAVKESVLLKTNSDMVPEFSTQLAYYMEPVVAAYPDPLFVSKEKIAYGEEQLINIECQPGFDMRIADLSVNNDKVKMSIKDDTKMVDKGKRFKLILTFPQDFKFDPNNTLILSFKAKNVPDEPTISIPVIEK